MYLRDKYAIRLILGGVIPEGLEPSTYCLEDSYFILYVVIISFILLLLKPLSAIYLIISIALVTSNYSF